MLFYRTATIVVTMMTALCISTQADALTYGDPKVYVCPIGGEKFEASIPLSGSSFGMYSNLKRHGAIESPWPLPQCPTNKFVMFNNELSDDELAQFTTIINSDVYKAIPSEAGEYYYLAVMLEQAKYPIEQVAYTYLQASWQVSNQPKLWQLINQKALQYYEQILKERLADKHPADPKRHNARLSTAILMVGELNRLLGNFDVAKAHFDTHQNHPVITANEFYKKVVKLQHELIENKHNQPVLLDF